MSRYLPKCCFVRATCAGDYEVCHNPGDVACRWDGDGVRRIIGTGRTRGDAIADAREVLMASGHLRDRS